MSSAWLINGICLLKRIIISRKVANPPSRSLCSRFFALKAWAVLGHEREYSVSSGIDLSPLFPDNGKAYVEDYRIELVDDAAWNVSQGLKDAFISNKKDESWKTNPLLFSDQDYNGSGGGDTGVVNFLSCMKDELDFDEIVEMRIRKNLFYKIDKDSKEAEEYKFDFHRRKSLKNQKEKKDNKLNKNKESSTCKVVSRAEETTKRDKKLKKTENKKTKESFVHDKNADMNYRLHGLGDECVGNKQRIPTFNQLTAPYHEPFCLDIYISKGSVRASIVHRATSNVVAVSHSISKDMKFDLESTKNRGACVAVGEVLAQRALADDIHNIVYTPRKREKLEGKLEIVLKSIMDSGIDVKVKQKQNKSRKSRVFPPRTRD